MSDLRKAALAVVHAWDTDGPVSTMEDLRAALAHPEPEPVCDKDPQGCWSVRCQLGKVCKNAPPQRKPLTEEQIAQIDWKDGETLHDFARAIEKAHGIGGEE